MECEEIRVDLRTIPHSADRQRSAQLLFRQLNHTLPFSEEYNALLRELLGRISARAAPLHRRSRRGAGYAESAGGVLSTQSAGDGAGRHHHWRSCPHCRQRPAAFNNHDPYDLDVLTCKPVEIGTMRGSAQARRCCRCARGAARRHRRGLRGHEGCARLMP